MVQLEKLNLGSIPKLTDLSVLSANTNLIFLGLSGFPLDSFRSIPALPKLQDVDLGSAKAVSLEGFQSCGSVRRINLTDCGLLSDFRVLQ